MRDELIKKTAFANDPEMRLFAAGSGSWLGITANELDLAKRIAEQEWAERLHGIEYPWLCWNVADEWCLVQQRLVESVGWTPIVGYDPRAGAPPLIDGAVLVDFNAVLNYPKLQMIFPVELAFLFAPRLAFWHSDLLVREPLLRQAADLFKELSDGEIAAVDDRARWYKRLRGHRGRYWELLGCTTRGASENQFAHGCGWWRRPALHPNCPSDAERQARQAYTWDHGAGILIWEERHGGKVIPIAGKPLDEGHCTSIGNKRYIRKSPLNPRRDLSSDLVANYDLGEVCKHLNLTHFLSKPPMRRVD